MKSELRKILTELTYADFKIGQVVMCNPPANDRDFEFYADNEHLIPGEYYTITDLEFRFPDTICVNTSRTGSGMFCPIKFFDTQSVVRDNKLNEILK
jgi:hypothetical protein